MLICLSRISLPTRNSQSPLKNLSTEKWGGGRPAAKDSRRSFGLARVSTTAKMDGRTSMIFGPCLQKRRSYGEASIRPLSPASPRGVGSGRIGCFGQRYRAISDNQPHRTNTLCRLRPRRLDWLRRCGRLSITTLLFVIIDRRTQGGFFLFSGDFVVHVPTFQHSLRRPRALTCF